MEDRPDAGTPRSDDLAGKYDNAADTAVLA